MRRRYQLRSESGLVCSRAALGAASAATGSGGVAGLFFGGGGGASQTMTGVSGVALACAATPSSWP